MNINRNNYEEFFLLYVDNELSAAEKYAVEEFVQQNPDLNDEWETYLQTKISPDQNIEFTEKSLLFRNASHISLNNYEAYFLSYVDNELDGKELEMVESFLVANPRLQEELDWIKKAKLNADEIVFADKASLYRREGTTAKVLVIKWWRVAAAASVILIAGLFWLNYSKNTVANNPIVARVTDTNSEKSNPGITKANEDKGVNSGDKSDKSGAEQIKPTEESLSELNQNSATDQNRIASKQMHKTGKVDETQNAVRAQENIPGKDNGIHEIASTATPKMESVTSDEASSTPENNGVTTKVAPNVIDIAATKPDKNNFASDAVYTNNQGVTYLETDNSDKKTKGKFRTFFRKAARFVDRVTNPEFDDKKSVVRIANIQLGTQ